MIKRLLIVSVAFICVLPLINAQRWKKYRVQVACGLGAANFLGELGGADDVGSAFMKDLEFASTRPSTQILLRYRLTEKLAWRTSFNMGIVGGADSLTDEYFRNKRNLSFQSPIAEFSTEIEYNFIKEPDMRRYRLRGVRGGSSFAPNIYGFIGIGGFYYSPRAKYNGKWYKLRSLGTEGQKLGEIAPTRKPYSPVSICIPAGIGFRIPIDRKFSVGFEYGVRKTFTDYIDDVSTTYVDNDLLRKESGEMAANLADRTQEIMPDEIKNPGLTQRGDPTDKDVYMFSFITLYYKFNVSRRSIPSF